MIKSKNFSGQLTPDIIDDEYHNCNFTQQGEPDGLGRWRPVRIFPGDPTPRTFVECNLINCEVPLGSTLVRCNTSIIEYLPDNEIYIHGRTHPVTGDVELKPTPHHEPPRLRSQYVRVKVADNVAKEGLETSLRSNPLVEQIVE